MKHLQVSIAFLITAALLGVGGAEAARSLPVPVAPAPIDPPAFSASELLAAPAADVAAACPFRLDLAGQLLLLAANRSAEAAEGEGEAGVGRFGLELASSRPWMWPPEGLQGGKRTSGCFSSEIGSISKEQKVFSRGSHLGCYQATDTTQDMDTFRYGYGGADQLTYIRRESTGENVTFEPGPNGRIASRDGVQFGYDGVGRRTLDDRHAYKWDWRGRLYEVTILETGHRIAYEYDALGRLMWRKHLDQDEGLIERRDFIWDGNGLVSEVAYTDDAATTIRWRKTYLLGPEQLDDQYHVRVETFPSDPAIAPIDTVYTYLRDEMGTVIALIEEVPVIDPEAPPEPALRYHYSPYGEVTQVEGAQAAGVTVAGLYDIAKPFPGGQNLQFHGLWADPITGLSYARARWLSTRGASWLSEDPKKDVDSPNLYAYVAWRPQSAKDPFGEVVPVRMNPLAEAHYKGRIEAAKESGRQARKEYGALESDLMDPSFLKDCAKNYLNCQHVLTYRALRVGWFALGATDAPEMDFYFEPAVIVTTPARVTKLAKVKKVVDEVVEVLDDAVDARASREIAEELAQDTAQSVQARDELGRFQPTDGTALPPGGLAESSALARRGLQKNTKRIPSATGTKDFRIPDGFLDPDAQRHIIEIKDVDTLSLTDQLLDDIAYVTRDGGSGVVEVVVDTRTQISGPLQKAAQDADNPIRIVTESLR